MWDMYSSDAEDTQWERHQESIRSNKRKEQLAKMFLEINPSLEEAREAWLTYRSSIHD